MAENATDSTFNGDPEGNITNLKSVDQVPQAVVDNTESYSLKIFQSSLNLLAHILIGATVGISILFSCRTPLPLGATPLHIVLCVIGYQLLMGEAILSLCPHNGWSASLRLVDKRRAHTVLQILGSGLAIAGSIIKALDKAVNWNTLHGQFGLVAMVFTAVCLVNGLTSLYAFELRKCLPGNLSKITHICFGIVAFVTSAISLCYGFDKNSFKNWATPALTYTIIGFTACFTAIIIINPTITFFSKSVRVFKK
ncbi:uncharacterized protein LOC124535666 [Vanessa cardui]|uniref:uncharacterized protein LOC124535666 n=1 Tax=Vanessa cardui TaxID=171605 RepID=UPI001F146DB0|nr:uncharacterized protein LOC124535666 [Vanessa cardui]